VTKVMLLRDHNVTARLGWGKTTRNVDLRPINCYMWETIQDGQWKTNMKSHMCFLLLLISMTLNYPDLDLKGTSLFDVEYLRKDTR